MCFCLPADLFKLIASAVYKVPFTEVTTDQRAHTKTFCYGSLYGGGAKKLSEDVRKLQSVC